VERARDDGYGAGDFVGVSDRRKSIPPACWPSSTLATFCIATRAMTSTVPGCAPTPSTENEGIAIIVRHHDAVHCRARRRHTGKLLSTRNIEDRHRRIVLVRVNKTFAIVRDAIPARVLVQVPVLLPELPRQAPRDLDPVAGHHAPRARAAPAGRAHPPEAAPARFVCIVAACSARLHASPPARSRPPFAR